MRTLKWRPSLRPGVAGMEMAVVVHLERRRRQRRTQRRLDVGGGDAHRGLVSAGTALPAAWALASASSSSSR